MQVFVNGGVIVTMELVENAADLPLQRRFYLTGGRLSPILNA